MCSFNTRKFSPWACDHVILYAHVECGMADKDLVLHQNKPTPHCRTEFEAYKRPTDSQLG